MGLELSMNPHELFISTYNVGKLFYIVGKDSSQEQELGREKLMCLLCQDNGMKQRPGVENLEECLYFIFIGGQHLNASWSHDGRCLLDAMCVFVSVHAFMCTCTHMQSNLCRCLLCVCTSPICACFCNVQICLLKISVHNYRCLLLWLLLRIEFNKHYPGTSL